VRAATVAEGAVATGVGTDRAAAIAAAMNLCAVGLARAFVGRSKLAIVPGEALPCELALLTHLREGDERDEARFHLGRSVPGPGAPMRKRVSSGSPWEPQIGFSRALRVDDRVLVSGTAPVWPDGSCPDDVAAQTRRCFEIVEQALTEAGAEMSDVVRTRMYIVSPDDAEAVGAVHGELFADVRPAATMVVVQALLDPRWKVEVEAEATLGA